MSPPAIYLLVQNESRLMIEPARCVIVDRYNMIAPDAEIGYVSERDRARFHRGSSGIVFIRWGRRDERVY